MKKYYFLASLFLIFITLPCYAERITQFDEIVIVNPDASIDVTENITVSVNGEQIKHGIMRWLPLRFTDSYHVKHAMNYHVTQVLVNNSPSDYHIVRKNSQYIIYVGNKNIFLTPGTYVNTIGYHVDNAINFLKDGDELYWNVTGNDWSFPIDQARVLVSLPAAAKISQYTGYTGRAGETGSNYTAKTTADNQIVFTTTSVLSPGENLTIAVAWPKGIVQQPTWLKRWSASMNYDSNQLLVLAFALIAFFYYLIVWYFYAQAPLRGTIIPMFEPPANLSPAAVRYIMRMGFDMKTFTAAIISMATKGLLKIENENDEFTISKCDGDVKTLSPEEKSLYMQLFSTVPEIKLSVMNSTTLRNAKTALSSTLKKKYEDVYFVTNTNYLIPGVILTIFGYLAAIATSDTPAITLQSLAWLSIWSFAGFTLFYKSIVKVHNAMLYVSFSNIFSAFTSSLFAIPFLIVEVFGIVALSETVPLLTMPVLFLMAVMNIFFYFVFREPTTEGRKIMDQIEGFKLFFYTTERFRIDHAEAPDKTTALYEKYLPYAVALDVEYEWGEQLNQLLQKSGIDPNTYQPVWYSGTPWTSSTTSSFPLFLGACLGTALASTTVSSSASGGGGFSGGGGGGGGGGGW